MKKQFLLILALLLTAAIVTATVLNTGKKATPTPKSDAAKTECSTKKSQCSFSRLVCN